MPIAIKTVPPMTCTLCLKSFPSLLPKLKPAKDRRNAITPMVTTGIVMDALRREKLSPTANASMLVATERINRTETVSLASFSSFAALAE